MICAIAAIYARIKREFPCIWVVFSSKILQETDRRVYDQLSDVLEGQIVIKTAVGVQSITNQVDKQDLIILDEGDWHLFDNIP